MSSTTVFANYTMTSAPSLNTSDTVSLCNVLDACLVNGFGSYTAPGWSILYSESGQRVYQAPQGNQFPLYINESNNPSFGSYESQVATWWGMEAWNGPTTAPTNVFPTTINYPFGMPFQKWYNSSSAVGIPWWFFGNKTCFWFIVGCTTKSGSFGGTNTTYNTLPFFYGDIIPFDTSYKYGTLIAGMSANGYTSWSSNILNYTAWTSFLYKNANPSSANYGFGSPYTAAFIARSYNGNDLSPAAGVLYRGAFANNSGSFGGAVADPQTNKIIIDQPLICVGGNESSPVGKIPGLWNSISGSSVATTYNSGDTFTDTAYSSTSTFYVFNDNTYEGYYIEYDPSNPWS